MILYFYNYIQSEATKALLKRKLLDSCKWPSKIFQLVQLTFKLSLFLDKIIDLLIRSFSALTIQFWAEKLTELHIYGSFDIFFLLCKNYACHSRSCPTVKVIYLFILQSVVLCTAKSYSKSRRDCKRNMEDVQWSIPLFRSTYTDIQLQAHTHRLVIQNIQKKSKSTILINEGF